MLPRLLQVQFVVLPLTLPQESQEHHLARAPPFKTLALLLLRARSLAFSPLVLLLLFCKRREYDEHDILKETGCAYRHRGSKPQHDVRFYVNT